MSEPSPSAPASPASPSPQAQVQEVAYAIYCGDINAANGNKFVATLTGASQIGVKHVHILLQTWGGFPGDAVFIYNLLRNLPLEVTFYNAGQISSAGVTAFLGARHRITTRNAVFMIHRSHVSPQQATAKKLKSLSEDLEVDDTRTTAIFRERLKLPTRIWEELDHRDVFITGEQAVEYKIADSIGEFAPPAGTKIYNAIP